MNRRWVATRMWGIAVGVTVTLAIGLCYRSGKLDWLVLAASDWSFKHFNQLEASPDVVMIDVNDFALERVHRWPWPRALHADLVDVLHEVGAAAVLMDVVFAEPMAPRLEHPALTPDYDVDRAAEVLGELDLSAAIHDDDALARAMGDAGNVYPAMYFRVTSPRVSIPRLLARAEELLTANPDLSVAELGKIVPDGAEVDIAALYHRARIARVLREDFSLEVAQAAERLNVRPELVDRYLPEMKRHTVRNMVAEYLEAHPAADFAAVRKHFLPALGPDEESPPRQELLRAFRARLALTRILTRVPAVPESLRGRIPHGWDVTPPLDKLAGAAHYVGLVTFEKDEVGGVLRRVPLLVEVEGRLVKQLGFAVVCDHLAIDDASFAISDSGNLTMSDRAGERTWSVPLDENGMAVLNWHIDRHRPQWEHSFSHIAVSRIMEVALNRAAISRNESNLGLRMAEAVRMRFAEQPPAYAEYVRLIRNRNTAEAADPQAQQARIAAIETETREWLAFAIQSIEGVEPESPEEVREFAAYRDLAAALDKDQADAERKNAVLRQRNAEIVAQLKPLIEHKLCFVGYTASSVADMVNTPVFENTPGVLAHANVANTFIQGRFPRLASATVNYLLLVLAGVVVSVITSVKGPWVSLISVGLAMAVVLGGGAVLFYSATYIVATVVAAVVVFLCWAFITLYRQLTEERDKRNLARALGRSTSPAIAAGIIQRAGRLDLRPKPAEVSCYFSDLQGFTTLSERLGPEDTQAVLNRYLERMSNVLVPYGAFSKFMGDGIFAFFNAPLLPVERHQRVACEAAIDCVEALEQLKQEQSSGRHAEVFGELVMRAGVHPGPVYVGEFGSDNQTDYTCIGDTVNLAARLEPANKAFGTQTIVSGVCRDAAGDDFAFRSLGRLQVKGKAEAVAVFELLGRAGQVDETRLDYARRFGAAVERFQRREFTQARTMFESCANARPGDAAATLYLEETDRHIHTPPGSDWNQGIRLTTK